MFAFIRQFYRKKRTSFEKWFLDKLDVPIAQPVITQPFTINSAVSDADDNERWS